MQALLDGIKKGTFAVFGRAGMDMFADPPGTKAEVAETFRSDLGGSSANICAGLCKLGMQSALVTSVSDDNVGRFCTNRLKHYGVDTGYLKVLGGEYRISLAVYESTMDDFQLCIYRNNAVDFQVTEEDVDRVDYGAFGALITAGTVFAGEPSRGSTFRAFEGFPKLVRGRDKTHLSCSSFKSSHGVQRRALRTFGGDAHVPALVFLRQGIANLLCAVTLKVPDCRNQEDGG